MMMTILVMMMVLVIIFLHILLCGYFYFHFDGDGNIGDDDDGDHISVSPSFVVISFAASPLKTHSSNMHLMWFCGFIISLLHKYSFFLQLISLFVEAWLLPSKRQHTAENDNAPSSDEQVSSS